MSEKQIVITTVVSILLIMLLLLGFILGIMLFYQKKRKAFLAQLHEVKEKYEKEILRVQLEVQEQTLAHASREIHDNIGQSISLAKLYLTSIPTIGFDHASNKIEDTLLLLTKTMDDLRDLSKSLTLEEIKGEGLGKAIESQVTQLRKTGTYTILFEIQGNLRYLDDQREIILFRIFQEAINNIIRHADAATINIVLNYQPTLVSLSISDDGVGFAAPGATNEQLNPRGRGLGNMRGRAGLIGAELLIESQPGRGTSLEIKMPITENAYGRSGSHN